MADTLASLGADGQEINLTEEDPSSEDRPQARGMKRTIEGVSVPMHTLALRTTATSTIFQRVGALVEHALEDENNMLSDKTGVRCRVGVSELPMVLVFFYIQGLCTHIENNEVSLIISSPPPLMDTYLQDVKLKAVITLDGESQIHSGFIQEFFQTLQIRRAPHVDEVRNSHCRLSSTAT